MFKYLILLIGCMFFINFLSCEPPLAGGYEEAFFKIFAVNTQEGSYNDFAAKVCSAAGLKKCAGMETIFAGFFANLLNLLKKCDVDIDRMEMSKHACLAVKNLNGLIQFCTARGFSGTEHLIAFKKKLSQI